MTVKTGPPIPGHFADPTPSTAAAYTRTGTSRDDLPWCNSTWVLMGLALLLVIGLVILVLSCTLYG
jgi:hypothetical protein